MSDRELYSAMPLAEPLTRREHDVLALAAQGYSAPEIAQHLTLATSSVKYHLQNLYGKLGVNSKRQAVQRARELGLLNGHRTQPWRPVAELPTLAHPGPVKKLPLQLTSFVGREVELKQLRQRLAEYRLVTLTGSGGVGKTRLALRAAEEVMADFPDGVALVDLGPVSDPAQVGQQIQAGVGLEERRSPAVLAALALFLRERRFLLVLDNCEHVLAACASLAEALLRTCAHLTIMATSREALGIAGEAEFTVPTLPYPDPHGSAGPDRLEAYPAVKLFVDRARTLAPGFRVTAHNAPYLARICYLLDGIPLALELAAARVRLLSTETLAARLDNVFYLLNGGNRTAPPRQQTLRATLDWSYQLLTEAERLLFQRLAIFAGDCSLEAIEAVCSGDGLDLERVLDSLASLVAKSMVVASHRPGMGRRFQLLKVVRHYARGRLDEAGDAERMADRHLVYYLGYVESNSGRAWYGERAAWWRLYIADQPNLHLALTRAFSIPRWVEAGVRLTVALMPLWLYQAWGFSSKWVQPGLEACQGEASLPAPLKAHFLAWAALHYQCLDQGLMAAEQSLALSRSLGPEDREILGWSLLAMAVTAAGFCQYGRIPRANQQRTETLLVEHESVMEALGTEARIDPRIYRGFNLWLRALLAESRDQDGQARAYALESIQHFTGAGDGVYVLAPYLMLGAMALRRGELDEARAAFETGLGLAVKRIDVREGPLYAWLCETELRRGELTPAFGHCQEYIRLAYEMGTPHNVCACLEMAARLFALADQPLVAARLSGAAEALSEKDGRPTSPEPSSVSFPIDWRMRYADASLDALAPGWPDRPDREALRQAWNAGRGLDYHQAVAFALNEVSL